MKIKSCMFLIVVCIAVSCTLLSNYESDAENGYAITVNLQNGSVFDQEGNEFTGGEFKNSLTLTFVPKSGYEFVEWNVSRGCDYTAEKLNITITAVYGDIVITPVARNFSPSQGITYILDEDGLPITGDKLVKLWSFGSTSLDKSYDPWLGMPSTPLIVGDLVYIRAGDYLYAVDIYTGVVKHYVKSITAQAEYYHYISYANGVIIDTTGHKAYDLELNYLYDIPANLKYAVYYDGYAYGFLYNADAKDGLYYQMYKMSLEPGKDLDVGVKKNLLKKEINTCAWAQYGQYSTPIFKNGWMFFLEANGVMGRVQSNECVRNLTAFNVDTEEVISCVLTGVMGMPWDDGWLTSYNDYFYVTAYTAGLFDGVIKGLEDKHSCIQYVRFDFDKGCFDKDSLVCVDIKDPAGNTFKGIASPFIVHNNRGYVNVKAYLGEKDKDLGLTCLIAYDIKEDGTLIPTQCCKSEMSHGGIVMNLAHEREGKIFIYLLPYESSKQAIYTFTDEYVNGEWVLKDTCDKIGPTRADWGSQGVRSGPNGEVIYYVDSGYIDCYITADKNRITVIKMDGDAAYVDAGYGADAGAVVRDLFAGCTISGGKVQIGEKTYIAYGFNEVRHSWKAINNLTDTYTTDKNRGIVVAPYRYVILLEENSDNNITAGGDKGWYYLADESYQRCNMFNSESLVSVIGKYLFFSETAPGSEAILLPPSVYIQYDGSAEYELLSNISINSIDYDSKIINVEISENKLIIRYVKEGQTTLSLTIGDKTYKTEVETAPYSSVDPNGTTTVISNRDSVTESGETVSTEKKTVTNKDKSNITENTTVTVKDSDGNIKTVTTTERTQSTSIDTVSGKTTTEELTVTTVKDSAGKVISEKSESRILEVTDLSDGISKSVTDYNVEGNGNRTNTVTTQYTRGNIVLGIIVTEVYGSSSDPTSTEIKYSLTDPSSAIQAVLNGESFYFTVTGADADLSSLASIVALEDFSDRAVTVVSEVELSESMLEAVVKMKSKLIMNSTESSITFDDSSLENLLDNGSVSFDTTRVSTDTLNDAMKDAVGDAILFDISVNTDNGKLSQFGKFTIKLNVTPNGDHVHVYRIDEDGTKHEIEGAAITDGGVVFSANHLSYYAVEFTAGNSSGDSSDTTVVILVVAIIIIIAAALAFWKLKGNRGTSR